MPIKINELVIQVKVYETNKQADNTKSMPSSGGCTTELQKMAMAKDVLHLLKDQEVR